MTLQGGFQSHQTPSWFNTQQTTQQTFRNSNILKNDYITDLHFLRIIKLLRRWVVFFFFWLWVTEIVWYFAVADFFLFCPVLRSIKRLFQVTFKEFDLYIIFIWFIKKTVFIKMVFTKFILFQKFKFAPCVQVQYHQKSAIIISKYHNLYNNTTYGHHVTLMFTNTKA